MHPAAFEWDLHGRHPLLLIVEGAIKEGREGWREGVKNGGRGREGVKNGGRRREGEKEGGKDGGMVRMGGTKGGREDALKRCLSPGCYSKM